MSYTFLFPLCSGHATKLLCHSSKRTVPSSKPKAQDGEVLALRPSGEVLMKKLDTARRVVFHHDAGREDVAAHHEFG